MLVALSNVGHRRALSILRRKGAGFVPAIAQDPLVSLMPILLEPWRDNRVQSELLAKGWIEVLPDSTQPEEIRLRQARNPLEHFRKVIIEFTTCCDFSCAHCYNTGVGRRTESDLVSLDAATAVFADMLIPEFSFIGGEVTKYGTGWLELASAIRARGASIVSVLTNGWFLGERDFDAAGRRYPDESSFLAELRDHGVTHVNFSLDGKGEVHDRSRRSPGLYARVLEGIARVREAGLEPRVSLLSRAEGRASLSRHVEELAGLIYGQGAEAGRLWADETNIVSNFIDIGNGARSEDNAGFAIADFSREDLRCAGFYRPAPRLTLKANGELATCRLANAGEGYGNFHERPMVEILNHLQDSFVFRVHAEKRIGDYLPFVDTSLFGTRFVHPCSLRAIVTMIARRMHDEGIGPGDSAAIARVNREVATVTGHI